MLQPCAHPFAHRRALERYQTRALKSKILFVMGAHGHTSITLPEYGLFAPDRIEVPARPCPRG